jgi:hypothetical protein
MSINQLRITAIKDIPALFLRDECEKENLIFIFLTLVEISDQGREARRASG